MCSAEKEQRTPCEDGERQEEASWPSGQCGQQAEEYGGQERPDSGESSDQSPEEMEQRRARHEQMHMLREELHAYRLKCAEQASAREALLREERRRLEADALIAKLNEQLEGLGRQLERSNEENKELRGRVLQIEDSVALMFGQNIVVGGSPGRAASLQLPLPSYGFPAYGYKRPGAQNGRPSASGSVQQRIKTMLKPQFQYQLQRSTKARPGRDVDQLIKEIDRRKSSREFISDIVQRHQRREQDRQGVVEQVRQKWTETKRRLERSGKPCGNGDEDGDGVFFGGDRPGSAAARGGGEAELGVQGRAQTVEQQLEGFYEAFGVKKGAEQPEQACHGPGRNIRRMKAVPGDSLEEQVRRVISDAK